MVVLMVLDGFLYDFSPQCTYMYMGANDSQGADNDWAKTEHYENMPMQYTVIFKIVKNETFQ